MLWKCIASYEYLAFPNGTIDRAPVLQKLGIGSLLVDEGNDSVAAPIQLPRDGLDFQLTQKVHPSIRCQNSMCTAKCNRRTFEGLGWRTE